MGDIDEIGVDTAEGKDYASIVFLHGKEVKWDEPIDTLFIKPAMEEEMKRYARLCDILLCDCEKRIHIKKGKEYE